MKTVTIRDLRHRWPETERELAREGEILITRDSKPVARLTRIEPVCARRPRFDPVAHGKWQRRAARDETSRWVDAALAEQRAEPSRPNER